MKKVQWNSNYDQRIIEMLRILSQNKNIPINSIIEKAVLVFIENECFQKPELEELCSLLNAYCKKESTNIIISIQKDREGLLKVYEKCITSGIGTDYLSKIISELTPEWFTERKSCLNLDDEKHLASNLRELANLLELEKEIELINSQREELMKKYFPLLMTEK